MSVDRLEMERGELFVQAIHHACGTLGPSDITQEEIDQMAEVATHAAIAWVRRRNVTRAKSK